MAGPPPEGAHLTPSPSSGLEPERTGASVGYQLASVITIIAVLVAQETRASSRRHDRVLQD